MEGVSVSRYPDRFVQNHDENETVNGCIEGYKVELNVSVNTSDYTIDGKNGKLFQIMILRTDGYPVDNDVQQFIGSFKTF